MINHVKILLLFSAVALLTACGSSKQMGNGSGNNSVSTIDGIFSPSAFLQKVYGNQVYVKNIVADIDFSISSGDRDISVGGSLKMRRNDVIRIQLVAFGLMEVGRLEFTPEYVMIQDRINKQFCKADYTKVGFLKDNGLDFYALQALFWNQLHVPGNKQMTESLLSEFSVAEGTSNVVSLERGKFKYNWNTDKNSGLIESVNVFYKSASHGTTNVDCQYAGFKPLGNNRFPTDIQLNLQTTAIKHATSLKMGFKLNRVSLDNDWESRTTPSSKYTEVDVEQLLNNLMKL